tara:strand:- start:5114 stop:5566 length:453 start_codon:yes stop_codon:yes gene_type:complete
MDNLNIWNKLAKSDPKYLKKVSFGSRSFTAIDPQYQVRMMTEQFGPVGIGWGWQSHTEIVQLSNGDASILAHISVWHGEQMNMFGPFTGCRKFFDATKGRLAEDAPKMAVTDGLTKALSHLGCNADVFLGEMDGNKYAADSGKKPTGGSW